LSWTDGARNRAGGQSRAATFASVRKRWIFKGFRFSKKPGVNEIARVTAVILAIGQDSAILHHCSLTQVAWNGSRFRTRKTKHMKQPFNLFQRAGIFHCEDTRTGKQTSRRTRDQADAEAAQAAFFITTHNNRAKKNRAAEPLPVSRESSFGLCASPKPRQRP
jgi:hypothetical protein